MKTKVLLALAVGALSGCATTFNAVNPRPNVAIAGSVGKIAIEVGGVPDDAEPGRLVTIHQLRQSLQNGFRNAVGSKYTETGTHDAIRLIMDQATFTFENILGVVFLNVNFRGRWLGPDRQVLAEVSGNAKPRNPTESGPRHLEDLLEVMFEKIIEGYDRATSGAPAAAGPAVR